MTADTRLVITRVFDAPVERVYAAWTSEDMVKQWFCPSPSMTVPEAEFDVREGGAYRIVMRDQDGETYTPSGTYEKVSPNEQLVFSWKWSDSDLVTRVIVDLRAIADNRTELTLTHEGFPDDDTRDLHTHGWEACLAHLAGIL